MNKETATKLLNAIEKFGPPINELSSILRSIEDSELRIKILKDLGEVMRYLDGEIGCEARRTLDRLS